MWSDNLGINIKKLNLYSLTKGIRYAKEHGSIRQINNMRELKTMIGNIFFLTLYVQLQKMSNPQSKTHKMRHKVTILLNLISNFKIHHLYCCVWNNTVVHAHTTTKEIGFPM